MIPKIIHYFTNKTDIWEKNSMSTERMCLYSWRKYLSDYKFILWTDKNPEFEKIISKSEFAQKAYKLGLWAFVSDYIRFYVLYNFGGIYLDTDVQVLSNFDNFLHNKLFTSVEGAIIRNENIPEPAILGCESNHPLIKECLKIYESKEIYNMDFTANCTLKNKLYELYNFRYINYKKISLNDFKELYYNDATNYDLYIQQDIWYSKDKMVTIYPSRFFCPSWVKYKERAFTNETVTIHWNRSSWWNAEKINKLKKINLNKISMADKLNITYKEALIVLLKKTFNIKTYVRRIKNILKR